MTPAEAPIYTVEIRQLANEDWRWTLTTADEDAHPLYDGTGSFRFKRTSVSQDHGSLRRAVRRAAKELASYVERDVREELERSFEEGSARARATS